MVRTVEAKRVKTHWLAFTDSIATGLDTLELARDLFQPQEDIRIIGFLIWAKLEILGDVNALRVEAFVELTTVAGWYKGGTLGYASAIIGYTDATTRMGDYYDQHSVMFPEGHGVDLDEGEAVYINGGVENDTGNTQKGGGGAVIYYVER